MHCLVYCLFICLYCLFPITTVRHRRLRGSPGAQRSRLWAAASGSARQVILDHIDPMCSLSLSSIHIGLHALILYLSLIFRIWVHTWLAMLSHTVMSVVQVFPSIVILSLACVFVSVGRPFVEMWFDHGEDRCCGLSKVGMVGTVGFRQVMWLVMLDSAKDWILGVDTLGQHVPPHVWYGMACPLIRYAIGCVPCLFEWGWLLSVWPIYVTFCVNCLNHMVQKGPLSIGNIITASGGTVCGNCSKAWHTPIIALCNDM
jgi:hypothetical protein